MAHKEHSNREIALELFFEYGLDFPELTPIFLMHLPEKSKQLARFTEKILSQEYSSICLPYDNVANWVLLLLLMRKQRGCHQFELLLEHMPALLPFLESSEKKFEVLKLLMGGFGELLGSTEGNKIELIEKVFNVIQKLESEIDRLHHDAWKNLSNKYHLTLAEKLINFKSFTTLKFAAISLSKVSSQQEPEIADRFASSLDNAIKTFFILVLLTQNANPEILDLRRRLTALTGCVDKGYWYKNPVNYLQLHLEDESADLMSKVYLIVKVNLGRNSMVSNSTLEKMSGSIDQLILRLRLQEKLDEGCCLLDLPGIKTVMTPQRIGEHWAEALILNFSAISDFDDTARMGAALEKFQQHADRFVNFGYSEKQCIDMAIDTLLALYTKKRDLVQFHAMFARLFQSLIILSPSCYKFWINEERQFTQEINKELSVFEIEMKLNANFNPLIFGNFKSMTKKVLKGFRSSSHLKMPEGKIEEGSEKFVIEWISSLLEKLLSNPIWEKLSEPTNASIESHNNDTDSSDVLHFQLFRLSYGYSCMAFLIKTRFFADDALPPLEKFALIQRNPLQEIFQLHLALTDRLLQRLIKNTLEHEKQIRFEGTFHRINLITRNIDAPPITYSIENQRSNVVDILKIISDKSRGQLNPELQIQRAISILSSSQENLFDGTGGYIRKAYQSIFNRYRENQRNHSIHQPLMSKTSEGESPGCTALKNAVVDLVKICEGPDRSVEDYEAVCAVVEEYIDLLITPTNSFSTLSSFLMELGTKKIIWLMFNSDKFLSFFKLATMDLDQPEQQRNVLRYFKYLWNSTTDHPDIEWKDDDEKCFRGPENYLMKTLLNWSEQAISLGYNDAVVAIQTDEFAHALYFTAGLSLRAFFRNAFICMTGSNESIEWLNGDIRGRVFIVNMNNLDLLGRLNYIAEIMLAALSLPFIGEEVNFLDIFELYFENVIKVWPKGESKCINFLLPLYDKIHSHPKTQQQIKLKCILLEKIGKLHEELTDAHWKKLRSNLLQLSSGKNEDNKYRLNTIRAWCQDSEIFSWTLADKECIIKDTLLELFTQSPKHLEGLIDTLKLEFLHLLTRDYKSLNEAEAIIISAVLGIQVMPGSIYGVETNQPHWQWVGDIIKMLFMTAKTVYHRGNQIAEKKPIAVSPDGLELLGVYPTLLLDGISVDVPFSLEASEMIGDIYVKYFKAVIESVKPAECFPYLFRELNELLNMNEDIISTFNLLQMIVELMPIAIQLPHIKQDRIYPFLEKIYQREIQQKDEVHLANHHYGAAVKWITSLKATRQEYARQLECSPYTKTLLQISPKAIAGKFYAGFEAIKCNPTKIILNQQVVEALHSSNPQDALRKKVGLVGGGRIIPEVCSNLLTESAKVSTMALEDTYAVLMVEFLELLVEGVRNNIKGYDYEYFAPLWTALPSNTSGIYLLESLELIERCDKAITSLPATVINNSATSKFPMSFGMFTMLALKVCYDQMNRNEIDAQDFGDFLMEIWRDELNDKVFLEEVFRDLTLPYFDIITKWVLEEIKKESTRIFLYQSLKQLYLFLNQKSEGIVNYIYLLKHLDIMIPLAAEQSDEECRNFYNLLVGLYHRHEYHHLGVADKFMPVIHRWIEALAKHEHSELADIKQTNFYRSLFYETEITKK